MQVNKINSFNYINNHKKLKINQKQTNPLQKNIQSPNKMFSVYMGKDLISFGRQFKETLDDNYFHLPQGCSPDGFQLEAGRALNEDKNVIVEAPTGTGKTAVAHYVVSKNMEEGKTTFYTTPLKALSNQKLNEFRAVYGDENVGILTGDRRENVDAPIIIMTTEVYRNMALSRKYGERAELMDNLGTVIFDECHYMGDASRGATWEESIMYTPDNVQKLALSATIGNAKDIQSWMGSLTDKPVSLISIPSSERHVPLMFNTLETSAYKSEAKRMQKAIKNRGTVQGLSDFKINSKPTLSDFKNAVNTLSDRKQLPAIFFIFSRKFSRELLDYLSVEGPVLTTDKEQKEIERIVEDYKSKKYIGSDLNVDALKRGYAIHNAGIIPAQKELIEELFQKKLIKTVLATETLAAGINMPAKTVVMSSVYKPVDDNEDEETSVRLLTPNEFKQMSGRAGRRGIDTVGYVYTMPTDMDTEQELLMLELTDCNPLKSQYEPDYAFLTGYYKYNPDQNGLRDIFSKTFYSYSKDEQEKQTKVEELSQLSSSKTQVLKERGYISLNGDKTEVTQKGEMASFVRGYDALTLVDAITSGKFANITPETLAMIAGATANPPRPKEADIALNSDLSYIFDKTVDSVNSLQDNIISSINQKLSHFGKTVSDFKTYEDLLDYVSKIQIPDGYVPQEVKSELEELAAKRAKIYKIQKTTGKCTPQELVSAIQNGETIPTAVLEQNQQIVDEYKKRISSRDIDTHIEKLQATLEQFDTSEKGKKAKSRIEAKRAEVEKEIAYANAMKFLSSNIYKLIGRNFTFLKSNPLEQIKAEYNRLDDLYTRLTSKKELISMVKGLIELKYSDTTQDIESDNHSNMEMAYRGFNSIIKNGLEVFDCELKHGIKSYPQRYSKSSAQTLYSWAYLNKINGSTMLNWKQLLKMIPQEEADEGTIYRRIMQAADLLSQIGDIARAGMSLSTGEEEINYYKQLAKSALEARKLIIQEPVEV